MKRLPPPAPRILVLDVGGSSIKCLASGRKASRKFASGPGMTAEKMVRGVLKLVKGWSFDVVSIGYPGVVRDGTPAREPHNLRAGWVGFDYETAFGVPVRMLNDAAMQALGAYEGGKMLFLGLGTGLGSAYIAGGVIVPLELGHLRYSEARTYEDYVGKAGFKRLGKDKWRRQVETVVEDFRQALLPDYIMLGGGNAKKLAELPPDCRRGSNEDAFKGGFRLWDAGYAPRKAATHAKAARKAARKKSRRN